MFSFGATVITFVVMMALMGVDAFMACVFDVAGKIVKNKNKPVLPGSK
jgi:hypothetical protein